MPLTADAECIYGCSMPARWGIQIGYETTSHPILTFFFATYCTALPHDNSQHSSVFIYTVVMQKKMMWELGYLCTVSMTSCMLPFVYKVNVNCGRGYKD